MLQPVYQTLLHQWLVHQELARTPRVRTCFNVFPEFQCQINARILTHILDKKINSFHLNLYLTSEARPTSSNTSPPVATYLQQQDLSSMFVLDFNARFMHLTEFIFIIFVIDQPIIAYIHDLCDLKASANNNLYSNLKLQTMQRRVFPCSMLLTGQAQKLQSQSRNIILVKITNLLPEQKKQIYMRR